MTMLDQKIQSLMVQVVEATPPLSDIEERVERRLGTTIDLAGAPVTAERRPRIRPLAAALAGAAAVLVMGGIGWIVGAGGSRDTAAPPFDDLSSLTWSQLSDESAVFGGAGLEAVSAADIGLVIVGTAQTRVVLRESEFPGPLADEGTPGAWTSVDSRIWSRAPLDDDLFPEGAGFHDVVAGGPGVVAVGGSGSHSPLADAAVWTSFDGITWSRVPHDEDIFGGFGEQTMTSVTAGGPGLVAVGWDLPIIVDADAAVWTSPDGINWSRVPHDEDIFGGNSYQAMWSVAAGGPGLVAIGEDKGRNFPHGEPAVWTSVTGFTWTRVPLDESTFGKGRPESVAGSGSLVVAVGSDGTEEGGDAAVWISLDGVTWTRVPHDEAVFGGPGRQQMQSVTAGESGFVAVGWDEISGGAVWTSPDGITWSRVTDDATFAAAEFFDVTFSDQGVVVVGGSETGAPVWLGEPPR